MNTENNIAVWDIFIRIFHWSLVAAFSIAYISGESENHWHIYSGYTVLGLIIFRVLWGFVGSRYARFSDFVHPPKVIRQYISDLLINQPTRYLGHNPIGGWMVITMLVMLFIVTLSGLKVYALEQNQEASAALQLISTAHAEEDDDDASPKANESASEEFWEEIHETSSNVMLLLIVLHISGVVSASRHQHESLVKAMLTGKKSSK